MGPSTSTADREQARSPAEARNRYLHWLQKPLSVVKPQGVWFVGKAVRGDFYVSTTPSVISLKRNNGPRVYFRATQKIQIGEDPLLAKSYKVLTRAYSYTLSNDEPQSDELYGWHWHPDSPYSRPHLHFGNEKIHLPTGRVAFEDVLQFLVDEMDAVVPDREAALTAIGESRERFRTFRSWA